MKVKKLSVSSIFAYSLLTFGALIMILPFIWMLSTSLKLPEDVLSWPPELFPKRPSLINYVTVFTTAPFVRFFLNSAAMATISTISILLTSTLAGYIFAKFNFPLKNFLFILILSTAMVPFETYMIPLYLRMVDFHWVNRFIGLVSPYLVMSYGIFFMRQNVISTIPDELMDAARIDGISEFGLFWRIILPLMSGAAGALAIFSFMQTWAAFIWPLIITSSRKLWTMELGLGMFQYRFTVDLGPINAGSIISILPVLLVFLFMRRHIMSSMTLTGMKA